VVPGHSRQRLECGGFSTAFAPRLRKIEWNFRNVNRAVLESGAPTLLTNHSPVFLDVNVPRLAGLVSVETFALDHGFDGLDHVRVAAEKDIGL
jgi:hypothetical protein